MASSDSDKHDSKCVSNGGHEYRIATKGVSSPGYASALVPTPARIVEEHFAIRLAYVPAPWGEGCYVESFVLDHMPTGRRLFGGGAVIGAMTEEQCEAFAKSLATLPLDWSSSNPDLAKTGSGSPDFIDRARQAAEKGESIEWVAEGAGHA